MIHERVRGIVAPRYYATVSAAVGLDAAAEKLDGMPFDYVLLPLFKDDRSFVLVSAPVLRKQERPCVGVGIDDRDRSATAKSNRSSRTQRRDRARNTLNR